MVVRLPNTLYDALLAMRPVVVHRYGAEPVARDRSGHENHGHLVCTTLVGDHAALAFDGVRSRVVVAPSRSLRSLNDLLAAVEVRVDAAPERTTLVEGYLSFSLVVEPDRRLGGYLYAGDRWFGLQSTSNLVPLGQWITVAFHYDGSSHLLLQLDGRVVAAKEVALGPALGVAWPLGLNLGGWPDDDSRMLHGMLRWFELWATPV